MRSPQAKTNLRKAVEEAKKALAKAEMEERLQKESLRYMITKAEVMLGFVFVVIVLIVWFGR